MNLVDGSLKRPVTVSMATLAVVLFGAVALSRLGVELLPNISYPSLTVRTDLPDAAPGDVEQFVTRPIEEGVGVVPGLVRMHSVSRPGQSEVTLEFASNSRMDLASLAVREKLDLVTMPREAKRPAILRFDPSLDPILRVRLAGGKNLQRLRRQPHPKINPRHRRPGDGVPHSPPAATAGTRSRTGPTGDQP